MRQAPSRGGRPVRRRRPRAATATTSQGSGRTVTAAGPGPSGARRASWSAMASRRAASARMPLRATSQSPGRGGRRPGRAGRRQGGDGRQRVAQGPAEGRGQGVGLPPGRGGGGDGPQEQHPAAGAERPGGGHEPAGGRAAEDDLRSGARGRGTVAEEQAFEPRVTEAAPGRPADLERVGQGEELGGGGVEGAEAPGAVDRQGGVGQGMDERWSAARRPPRRRRPAWAARETGGHAGTASASRARSPGGVGLLGHQQHEGARLAGGHRGPAGLVGAAGRRRTRRRR